MAGFVNCDGESDFGGVSRIGRRIVNQFQPSPLNTGAPVAGRAVEFKKVRVAFPGFETLQRTPLQARRLIERRGNNKGKCSPTRVQSVAWWRIVSSDSWRAWLPLLRAGDVLAKGQLVEAYFDYVYSALLRLSRLLNSKFYSPLPDPEIKELAEELTGLAFGKAFADIESFDESKSALPSWIVWKGRASLKGTVLKEIREAARHARHGTPDLTELGFAGEDASGAQPDPADEAVRRLSMAESDARVRTILASMLPSHRQALTAAYLGAPSGSSAVDVISITMGTSKLAADSLLRRAVREFRRRWAAE